MSFLGSLIRKKPPLYLVVDVGSHAIKALLFEKTDQKSVSKSFQSEVGQGKAKEDSMENSAGKYAGMTLPRVVKKMFFKLPVVNDEEKIISRLREFMFTVVKEFERVPVKIIIAIGSNLAEESLRLWTVKPPLAKKKISGRGLQIYFQELFEASRDPARASLAHPCGILINGYSVDPDVLEKISAQEINFKTLVLTFKGAVGAGMTEMKQSLGGMPIEFLPLNAALQEVFASFLGWPEAFLVDVGGEETNLVFIKNKEIAEVASFALGAHQFLRGLAKLANISLEEAEDKNRQYIQGLVSEKVRAQMQKFLSEEALLWKKEFLAKLDNFYHLGPLSPKILLFGGGAHLPEIAAVLSEKDWFGVFSYTASPEVRVVDATIFFAGSSLGGFLQGPEDVGLASLVVYANAKQLLA